MATTFRFVSAISGSPTTLLDINDWVTYWLKDERYNFSPPTIRRAEAATILSDGSYITATTLDNRVLSFTLLVQTASMDARATAISALHAQLAKPGIIELRENTATVSKFFRYFPSTDTMITDDGKTDCLIDVDLLCEPYAYGLLVTQAGLAVSNDPAAGTRPLYLDVTGVTGDVLTPLIMTITTPSSVSFAFGIRRHGTPSNALPWVVQAETMTLAAGSATGGPDAAMSGGTPDYVRTTWSAGSGGVVTPLTPPLTKLLTSLTADHRGEYRVFARLRRNTASTGAAYAQLSYAGGSTDSQYRNDLKTLSGESAFTEMVDLGKLSIPISNDPVYDTTGVALGVGDVYIGLALARSDTAGTFTIDADYLVFVPADEDFTIIDAPSAGTGADLVLDGISETCYYLASGKVISRQLPTVIGAVAPMLAPGVTNRIVFLRDPLYRAFQENLITESTTVAVSWHPRFLYV